MTDIAKEEFDLARRIYSMVVKSSARVGTNATDVIVGVKYGANFQDKPYRLWRLHPRGKILWIFKFYSLNPLAYVSVDFEGDEERFRMDMTAAKLFLK